MDDQRNDLVMDAVLDPTSEAQDTQSDDAQATDAAHIDAAFLDAADAWYAAPSDDPTARDPSLLHAPIPAEPLPEIAVAARPGQRVHSPTVGYRAQPPDHGAITCAWILAELPSAQHRAGLALLVEYTRRFPLPPGAVLEIQRLDDQGLALRLDRAGLTALFDRVYAANLADSGRRRPTTGKTGSRPRTTTTTLAKVPESALADTTTGAGETAQIRATRALALGSAETGIPATGALATVDDTQVVPDGGPLREWAPPGDGGAWLRLWQHCLWSVLRAIPQQRWPYQVRARGVPPSTDTPRDVAESWAGLCGDHTSRMASTHFLGAMDANAESTPFLERSRRLFLLHFWPFVAQVFVPYASGTAPGAWTARGRAQDDSAGDGYALCIPDIVRLAAFVRLHPRVMRARPAERVHWRPRAAHIALGAAAAAQVERWMRDQSAPAWDGGAERIVAGFQVIEAAREANRVRILANRMVAPTPALIGALGIADGLQCPHLRRLVLGNALSDRPWWQGGDRLCTTLPTTRTLGDTKFRSDLRMLFTRQTQRPASAAAEAATGRDLEEVIHSTVQTWLAARIQAGSSAIDASHIAAAERDRIARTATTAYDPARDARERSRDSSRENPGDSSRETSSDIPLSPIPRHSDWRRLAGTAFHAARRRTTARDFTAWFVATFGAMLSATGAAPKTLIVALAREPDQVRTLTLLALAADP